MQKKDLGIHLMLHGCTFGKTKSPCIEDFGVGKAMDNMDILYKKVMDRAKELASTSIFSTGECFAIALDALRFEDSKDCRYLYEMVWVDNRIEDYKVYAMALVDAFCSEPMVNNLSYKDFEFFDDVEPKKETPNPFPLFGKNPNEVFNVRRKRG